MGHSYEKCPWPGCFEKIHTSALWGCTKHRNMLPDEIRNKLLLEYRPKDVDGQLVTDDYLEAVDAANDWVKAYQYDEYTSAHPRTQRRMREQS